MKKCIAKRAFVCLLVVAMLTVSLTACATKLNGTYTADTLIPQSFTFSGENVTFTAFGIVDAEGTYVIKDGKITITYSLLGLSYDWEKSFEKKGNSIFIDGTEFVKQ